MNYHNDTIVARATPPGRGGIGILRISGSMACKVAESVLGKLPRIRYADYLPFKDVDGKVLDRGIALWFKSPNSFTGEDVLELHGHGGPVILDMLLKRILTLPSIRLANPGEFSERAFLNAKLDLIQAEAIADLINVSSEQAARSALNSLHGMFSLHINYLVKALTRLRMHIEAAIDFPEEDILILTNDQIKNQLNEVITYLNTVLTEAQQGSILREGIKVVIIGPPNSGKSSLLNALAKREIAIVTDIAGTTRDTLHEYVNIDGMLLHIVDTAGLRFTDDKLEQVGIERTWKELEQADHILIVVDSTITESADLTEILPDFITRLPTNIPTTIVRNKVDITGETPGIRYDNNRSIICLSTLNGQGMTALNRYLKQDIGFSINNVNSSSFLARRRHIIALEEALNYLENSRMRLMNISSWSYELFAEELRLAQHSLKEITGEFASHNLLEEIFSNFCIGK